MLTLEELKQQSELIDEINWEMTPEEAVRLYLEWGNNWAHGDGYVIRSKDDYTHGSCGLGSISRVPSKPIECLYSTTMVRKRASWSAS